MTGSSKERVCNIVQSIVVDVLAAVLALPILVTADDSGKVAYAA